MSPDLIRGLLQERGAKLAPFNEGYVRLYMPYPKFAPCRDPLNNFVAEGAPDYKGPILVKKEDYKVAVNDFTATELEHAWQGPGWEKRKRIAASLNEAGIVCDSHDDSCSILRIAPSA